MQALYRRYRPQAFDAVIGQDHVADTLRNALRQNRLAHAYLFTGPRGTGKTSTARILAKAVNCLAADVGERPDNTCAICQAINEGRLLDLIEIDAASNTSVDDVRELRDRVAFAPTEARYKVYVIDEVHMLSTSAFNALLKTLEEPPAHVIFVLATTEPHKIPATIISRCQRFDFHRISTREIAAHLQRLAASEGVSITEEAVAIIARSATGSMRDAISLLDQITAYGHIEITAELARDVLGMVSGAAVNQLTAALVEGDPALLLGQLHQLIGQGVELNQLVSQLIDHLRTLLLLNVGRDASLVDLPDSVLETMVAQARQFRTSQLLHTIRALNEAALALKTPFAGYLPVELALLDAIGLAEAAPPPAPPTTDTPAAVRPAPPAARTPVQPAPAPASAVPASPAPSAAPPADLSLDAYWRQIIMAMRQQSPKTQAMLRSGNPIAVDGNTFIISFAHDFHREQVQGDIDKVNDIISKVIGRPLVAHLIRATDPVPARPAPTPAAPAPAAPEEDELVKRAIELGAQPPRPASS